MDKSTGRNVGRYDHEGNEILPRFHEMHGPLSEDEGIPISEQVLHFPNPYGEAELSVIVDKLEAFEEYIATLEKAVRELGGAIG